MIAVLQRVKSASVTVNEKIVGRINQTPYFIRYFKNDTESDAQFLRDKISTFRIFPDDQKI